jgi:Na+/melibiose symporter-like transporter
MMLAIITFIWAFFLSTGDAIAYGMICVLSGMALGADLALPPSIIADRITHQHKQSEATQFYAILAFIPKMAVALASGIVFLTLDFIGFQAGKNNDSEVLKNVIVLYAILPCLIKLASVVALKYMIKKEGI